MSGQRCQNLLVLAVCDDAGESSLLLRFTALIAPTILAGRHPVRIPAKSSCQMGGSKRVYGCNLPQPGFWSESASRRSVSRA